MDNTPISNQHDALITSSHDFEASTPSLSSYPLPTVEKAPSPVGILLSEVPVRQLRWLWQDRLPLGKLTTLEGEGGLGKSLLALDLAARVSSGQPMPDGTPGIVGGAGVVLIAAHDELSDTIIPRLQQAGADLSRIISICMVPVTEAKNGQALERPFRLPDDVDRLKDAIERVQARLVLIDPFMSLVDPKLASRDPQLQTVLTPLQRLISHAGAACLIVKRPLKARRKHLEVDEIQSWLLAAASGLLIVRDPGDEGRCVLAHITSKLSPRAASLSFQIESNQGTAGYQASLNWLGSCSHPLHELFNSTVIPPVGAVRQQIMEALKQSSPEALTVKELAEALPHISNANLRQTLVRMTTNHQLHQPLRGCYGLVSPSSDQKPLPSRTSIRYETLAEWEQRMTQQQAEQESLAPAPSSQHFTDQGETDQGEQVPHAPSTDASFSSEPKEEDLS